MIRHIVFFKFKEEASEGEQAELVAALVKLQEQIPLVKELEVAPDIGGKPNSYDIVLNSVFGNMDDLEAYAVHPDHVKVVERVKALCQSSAKVDYTIR